MILAKQDRKCGAKNGPKLHCTTRSTPRTPLTLTVSQSQTLSVSFLHFNFFGRLRQREFTLFSNPSPRKSLITHYSEFLCYQINIIFFISMFLLMCRSAIDFFFNLFYLIIEYGVLHTAVGDGS